MKSTSRPQLWALERTSSLTDAAGRLLGGDGELRKLPLEWQLLLEWPLGKVFPKTYRRLTRVRGLMRIFVAPLASSSLAARGLERALSARPGQVNRWLAGSAQITELTRRVHMLDWRLNLSGSRLRSLTLDPGNSDYLLRANLSGAELSQVRIFGEMLGADLSAAKLERSGLIGARIERASFEGAELTDVFFASLQAARSSFQGARISRCTFADVDFRGASFSAARLDEVVFERCTFAEADLDAASWGRVDFIACRELASEALPKCLRPAPGGQERTALGASPRRLDRNRAGVLDPIRARFSSAGTRSRPPLGYRLQTLARELGIWIALGSNYRAVREKASVAAGEAGAEMLAFGMPKRRWLAAIEILLGLELADTSKVSTAGLVYKLMVEDLKRRGPDLEGAEFPELVIVDGDFPGAHHLEIGAESYIVLSGSLEVMCTRLARYCIAWLLPTSIAYMDRWPVPRQLEELRPALVRELDGLRRSGGDISGLGRVQVKGMRDSQAQFLGLSFLSFVVGHELSHHLRARGLIGAAEHADPELQADIDAARMLNPDLDGGQDLLDSMDQLDPDYLRVAMREGEERGTAPPGSAGLPIEELRGHFLDGVSRFAECDWRAAMVTAFILAFGGSVGYRSDGDLTERALSVMRGAFGEEVTRELEAELSRPGSVLAMLSEIFYSEDSAA